jgi:general secretion pathway protein G
MVKARARGGFTLLELIVVIAIIGILATLSIPMLRNMPTRTRESALKTNLHTLRDVLDQYHGDKGHYPASLETLVSGGYLRAVPEDPITRSRETWVLVYEEGDVDAPPAETDESEDGPGIMDVHSGSDRLSLDGTPYAEW